MANKYLLSYGINKYPNAPLNGCVNDANDITELFTSLDYGAIKILDGDATKRNILGALQEYVSQLKYGDTLVVHNSTHGSWIPDRNGDEADGRDEVICAFDYESGGLIVDDELYEIMSQRAFGSRVIQLSDSCFSGTVSRVMQNDRLVRPGESTVGREKVRFMPPGYFLEGQELERAKRAETLPAKGTPRRGSVLISGCDENEYSYDAWINRRYNGAFTYTFIKHFKRLQAELGKTPSVKQVYNEIHQPVGSIASDRLPNDDYPQNPQLNASWYQKTYWRF